MTATDEQAERAGTDESRVRRIDAVSMVAGLVFLAMALAFTLAELDTVEDQVRYVWPAALLALGVGMLAGARQRR